MRKNNPNNQKVDICDNKVNLCDSCKLNYPDCMSDNIIFGDGKGDDNICACNTYTPITSSNVIEDSEEHFPNRFLNSYERKLLIAKIVKYTSTSIANTIDPSHRLECKLADSNLIQLFIENCPDSTADQLLINIGAEIRIHITGNPFMLGLSKEDGSPKTLAEMQSLLNKKQH